MSAPHNNPDTGKQTNAGALLPTLYAQKMAAEGWQPDDAQLAAIEALEQVRAAVESRWAKNSNRRWWQRGRRVTTPQGLYLWGGVGRGKTFMMDLFHSTLKVPSERSHFHRFMYEVHDALRALDEQRDPLKLIARDIAARARVLCFDEFFVADIADAMLLGRLTGALIDNGVVLVATSNVPPDQLYKDGLQRARFLPAIKRIEQHCKVMEVNAGVDYRLRLLDQAAMYHWPSDENTDAEFNQHFTALAQPMVKEEQDIVVLGRSIPVRRKAAGIVWFDFDDLCRTARSQNDYIALAGRLHTVFVSGLPQLTDNDNNAARRFIALVDEFYERKVNLKLAASVPIEQLYVGRKLAFEFERTKSRLVEMQSVDYLSAARRI